MIIFIFLLWIFTLTCLGLSVYHFHSSADKSGQRLVFCGCATALSLAFTLGFTLAVAWVFWGAA